MRFLALMWNERASDGSFARELMGQIPKTLSGWQHVTKSEGLAIYGCGVSQAAKVYRLHESGGAVVGTLFDQSRESGPLLSELGESNACEIRRTAGRAVCKLYWGRYVALVQSLDLQKIHILRDPTGAVPCVLTRHGEVHIACSHIEDCWALGIIEPSLDYEYLAAYLWHPRLVTSQTGLMQVRQVLAGECVTIANDGHITSEFYWTPQHVCTSRRIDDRGEARNLIRETVLRCISACSLPYERILHLLSGGLDSAVVLAGLAHRPRSVVCQTYFTKGRAGDEREFARKAAVLAGTHLVETALQSRKVPVVSLIPSTKLVSPTLANMASDSEATRRALVKDQNVQAVFSGQGGDHLFQQARTRLIAADHAWLHGLSPGLANTIVDTARLTRLPLGSVLIAVVMNGLLRHPDDPYKQLRAPTLLSKGVRDSLCQSQIRHPWLADLKGAPSAKLLQIFHLVDSQNLFREPDDYADVIHPLLSQPIIERCLQIPSYVLAYGGVDRALIREAFSRDIPTEIVGRQAKGATSSYFTSLLIDGLPDLRRLLIDGHLVGNGILDPIALDSALRESSLTRNIRLVMPILAAMSAEVWVRNWDTRAVCRPA